MKVLIVEPGKYPCKAEIANTLDAEQKIVGGMIEVVCPWEDALLVCNDNGLMDGLPLNRKINEYTVIAGTFFVCGQGSENFASLTDKQLAYYEKLLHDPQIFFRGRDENTVEARNVSPEMYDLLMDLTRKMQSRQTQTKNQERGERGE